ncbi:APC family permease [Legionella longbeachae]|uniref:Putative aminoacid/polyamine transporter n=1 Tax=Legionella longbeachae serogroup 1 (strain NSW150) TaxID=661367 RepID=D3HQN9_LEGLN|nr:APC family permease [Legionella longbeachae]VEE01725.1 aminoacid/polyamine transporter [Legionella oakridgensis]HBD7396482.1 amino acid permease [Legionella pneumophila]ARB91941.1 amino acid permease [Legionella longbeachae]ARM34875.1 amino acid permease [Legionella longbeachae]QEY50822.1 amino acid permease [Legionella longbeachae]
MSLLDKILGKPLTLKAKKKQQLSIFTGVPALGLDSLSSTAYGPEAALTVLLPAGIIGLHYFFTISLIVVLVLMFLYFSYLQTAAAYPEKGGAYIVASENLGKKYGLGAAISLILDYLLNVTVGISAGVAAIVSAVPSLHPYTLVLCLAILLMLTVINLRGLRETGTLFLIPVVIFIICMIITIVIGVFDVWSNGGTTHTNMSSRILTNHTGKLTFWMCLTALAYGLTAMTGVEAVSNAVSLFRKPTVRNAQWTLTIIVGTLALFLIFIGYLCPAYQIMAMNQNQPGYQTILSQLVEATTGKGVFYYISIISIFIVLAYSAQTSFSGFPRICRLLAEDNFLPHFFAERGRRLVFSVGIVILAIFSAVILIAFKGITNNLIPLFAVGSFSAFLFSQSGMVVYWLRQGNKKISYKLVINALGALITAIALLIIIITKFLEGAWIIIVLAPTLAFLMHRIKLHYKKIAHEIKNPIKINLNSLKPPIVIIPIQGLDLIAEKAIQFGMLLSEDITAVFIDAGYEDVQELKKLWHEKIEIPAEKADKKTPKLEIIKSPYRRIYKPLLNFVSKVRKERKNDLIAIIIPELIEPKWYEYLLHNIHATGLRALLFLEREPRIIVITIPWYLR